MWRLEIWIPGNVTNPRMGMIRNLLGFLKLWDFYVWFISRHPIGIVYVSQHIVIVFLFKCIRSFFLFRGKKKTFPGWRECGFVPLYKGVHIPNKRKLGVGGNPDSREHNGKYFKILWNLERLPLTKHHKKVS